MNLQNILDICLLLIILVGVFGLTYVVTKKIATVSKGMSHNKNMQIIEVLQLVPGQYLYIVKIGETYHLLSSTQKGRISYCRELEKEGIKIQEITEVPFKEQLSHLMKGKQVKEDEKK